MTSLFGAHGLWDPVFFSQTSAPWICFSRSWVWDAMNSDWLLSKEQHPSFPSDSKLPNFSRAGGYLKIYINIAESCSSLPAYETCHRAGGGCCCYCSASDGTQARWIWESVPQRCLLWSMPRRTFVFGDNRSKSWPDLQVLLLLSDWDW